MSTCYDKTGLTPDEAVDEVIRLRERVAGLLAALEDAAEWIKTGTVDGVFFDDQGVLESINAAIARAVFP